MSRRTSPRGDAPRPAAPVDTGSEPIDPATVHVRPAADFGDVCTLLGPKRSPDGNVCFCLSYRLRSTENQELRGPARGAKVRELCGAEPPPGVIAYVDGEPAAWAAVHPRSDTSLRAETGGSRTSTMPMSGPCGACGCGPGFRKRGLSLPLVEGAVDFARRRGAPAVEAYPVDNGGQRVDTTMAFVGTRRLFERAWFAVTAETASVLDGFPRVLMRRDL
jgi:hypothetical protein